MEEIKNIILKNLGYFIGFVTAPIFYGIISYLLDRRFKNRDNKYTRPKSKDN